MTSEWARIKFPPDRDTNSGKFPLLWATALTAEPFQNTIPGARLVYVPESQTTPTIYVHVFGGVSVTPGCLEWLSG